MSDLQVFAKYFKFINKLATRRCNCENSDCEHKAGRCSNPAKEKRIMYVGDVCDSCYENMPEEYRLPEKFDPHIFMDPRNIPDPPDRPGFNPKHPENPHHMKHRVDIDPDTLSYDNLHPDDPRAIEYEELRDREQEPFTYYDDILIDPKARKKRVEDRKRPKKYW